MDTLSEKRRFERIPYQTPLYFTILLTHDSQLQKIQSTGTIIDASDAGIGLTTEFPLQPGHVLEWDDKHRKGNLHIAIVKWSQKQANLYRAGLLFI